MDDHPGRHPIGIAGINFLAKPGSQPTGCLMGDRRLCHPLRSDHVLHGIPNPPGDCTLRKDRILKAEKVQKKEEKESLFILFIHIYFK